MKGMSPISIWTKDEKYLLDFMATNYGINNFPVVLKHGSQGVLSDNLVNLQLDWIRTLTVAQSKIQQLTVW